SEGELEFDLGATVVFRHVGQRDAFGQDGGEGVADHRCDRGQAVVDRIGSVAAPAQGVGDLPALAFGRVVAGAPAAPGCEVGVFEDFVQHHAETGAAETRVDVGGRGVGIRVGLVAAARGGLGGGAGQVVAGVGVGQLGEAVDPPVAGERPGGHARGGHVVRVVGAQPGQLRR